MANTTNTGTGGFPIDGKVQTYDAGIESNSPSTVDYSSGDIKVDADPKDLSESTKKTLAEYLSKTTLGQTPSSPGGIKQPNKYPINHSQGDSPVNLNLRDSNGYVPPLTNTNDASQPHFVDMTSGDSRSNKQVSLNIIRGSQKPTTGAKEDGNSLLKDATEPSIPEQPLHIHNKPDPLEFKGINTTKLKDTSPIKPYTKSVTETNFYSPDADFISNKNIPVSLREINPAKTRDIPVSNRKTLADYLADQTKINKFPISPNEDPSLDVKIKTVDGKPPSLIDLSNESKDYVVGGGQSHYKDIPVGIKSDPRIEKTVKNSPAAPEKLNGLGHNLLEKESQNEKGYSKNLFLNNRFNPKDGDQPGTRPNAFENYLLSNEATASPLQKAQFSQKYTLGESLGPAEQRLVTYGKLSQIGTALTTKAGTELGSDGNSPSGGNAALGAILPGINQLGVSRIDRTELEVRRILEKMPDLENISEGTLIDPAKSSWGSLNNVHDQFAGASNFGMQLLSVALVTALGLAIGTISLFLSDSSSESKKTDKQGRHFLGSYTENSTSSLSEYSSATGLAIGLATGKISFGQLIGINKTQNKFKNCLVVGILNFFGIATGSESVSFFSMMGKILTDGLASAAKSPGYYAVMARSINRSFVTIGDSFSALGKSFSVGAVQAISQIFNTLDAIRQSRFIKIINVFAQLGDQILLESTTNVEDGRIVTKIDALGNINAVQKSRLKNKEGELTLAWAAHRAPDMFVMPSSIRQYTIGRNDKSEKFGIPSFQLGFTEASQKGDLGINAGTSRTLEKDVSRIDTQLRENLESDLEAEYVPFYFHDIRTNEIISFHAFLMSLSDDYSASYDSVDGFGRVEPIKTYKGTQRKIGLSFMIAATSPDDFDYMWHKINKLTTLIYPQYSAGRRINSEDGYKIYAPFSQMIQASPMIRLRVGDLITSNYSKFGLARLFGLGSPNTNFSKTKVDNEKFKFEKAPYEEILKEYKCKEGETYYLNEPLRQGQSQSSVPLKLPLELPDGLVVKVENINNDTNTAIVQVLIRDEDYWELTQPQKAVLSNPMYVDSVIEQYFIVNISALSMTNDTRKNMLNVMTSAVNKADKDLKDLVKVAITRYEKAEAEIKAKQGNPEALFDDVIKFMNDSSIQGDTNVIARSFRSTGGRGLAGFIESMNFDWYDKTTWEIGRGVDGPSNVIGRRAPKMCKVTISFNPIHDISPGIDHMGFNRAPIYQVGPFNSQNLKKNSK